MMIFWIERLCADVPSQTLNVWVLVKTLFFKRDFFYLQVYEFLDNSAILKHLDVLILYIIVIFSFIMRVFNFIHFISDILFLHKGVLICAMLYKKCNI